MNVERAAPARAGMDPRQVLWLVGRLFPPSTAIDVVTTTAAFDAPPEDVWRRMMFYEEVPHRPSLLLRTFLPSPSRTQASGKEVGTVVACTYSRGGLTKRITVLDRPRLVRFEVLEQNLGIERCMTTVEGAYEFRADGRGTEVALDDAIPRASAATLAVASSGAVARDTGCIATYSTAWGQRGADEPRLPTLAPAALRECRRQLSSAVTGRTSTTPHSIELSRAATFDPSSRAGSPKLLSTTRRLTRLRALSPGTAVRGRSRRRHPECWKA